MNTNCVISLLDAIKIRVQSDPSISILWLYGSRAKGTAVESSDIDLAVLFKGYETDPLERRLRPELLAIDWQQMLGLPEDKLSVVDIAQAPIALAFSVIDAGKVLLCKDDGLLAQQETRIMALFEEERYQAGRYQAGRYG